MKYSTFSRPSVRPCSPCCPSSTIEEQYNYAELNELLIQNISKMPPQRQLIFRMSRCEHLSNREIAERLGLSVRSVDKHIELALKDLHNSIC